MSSSISRLPPAPARQSRTILAKRYRPDGCGTGPGLRCPRSVPLFAGLFAAQQALSATKRELRCSAQVLRACGQTFGVLKSGLSGAGFWNIHQERASMNRHIAIIQGHPDSAGHHLLHAMTEAYAPCRASSMCRTGLLRIRRRPQNANLWAFLALTCGILCRMIQYGTGSAACGVLTRCDLLFFSYQKM
jgi:hypothetical protein